MVNKPKLLIEPDLAPHYDAWKADASPESTSRFLTAINPNIRRAVTAAVGPGDDAILTGRARRMALDAMPRYDPAKSKIDTFLHNQLRGLRRVQRDALAGVKSPERTVVAAYALRQAEDSYRNEHDSDPTDEDLMDNLGVNAKQLAKLRSFHAAVPEGSLVDRETGAPASVGVVSQARDIWPDLVYAELDPYHKKIMEWTLGLNGRQPLSNQDIARKLGRSPGAISQAKARIQAKLDDVEGLSPFGG